MAKVSILIAFLPHLLYAMVRQPPQCSEYFTYVTKPGITNMLGKIEIPPPSTNDAFYLRVALNTATESSRDIVRLELARSIQESVRDVHFGRSLLYDVYYPSYEPIPSLSAIWFNNQQYCPGPEASGNIVATIELEHILYPPNEQPLVYGPWQEISQPYHRNSSNFRIDNPNYGSTAKAVTHPSDETANNECGITSYYTDDTNRLISNGEKTLPGQWPWFGAIYYRPNGNEDVYKFLCGGTLLTTKHVVTVLSCVVDLKNVSVPQLHNSQKFRVSLGQLQSQEWNGNHTGIINRAVGKIAVSSNSWKNPPFLRVYFFVIHNVLAILTLKMAVEFNAFIKPVCLWSGSTDLRDIVNMMGYAVGWGYERNITDVRSLVIYTEEPRISKVPLKNISIPLDHENLLHYKKPEGPCYSERGSGLVVFNTNTSRYELRGVMTVCSLERLGIYYVDITKTSLWIQSQISIT